MTNFGIKKKATQRHLICGQDSLHWAQWNQQQVWWWLNLQWLQRINQPGSVVPNGSIRSSLGAGEKVEAMEDNYKQKKLNLSKKKQALKTGVPKSDFCWKAIRFVFEIRVLFVFFLVRKVGVFLFWGIVGDKPIQNHKMESVGVSVHRLTFSKWKNGKRCIWLGMIHSFLNLA